MISKRNADDNVNVHNTLTHSTSPGSYIGVISSIGLKTKVLIMRILNFNFLAYLVPKLWLFAIVTDSPTDVTSRRKSGASLTQSSRFKSE